MKAHSEFGIITKTIENEARNVLDDAVGRTIKKTYFTNFAEKLKIMEMQHIVSNYCLDRLDKFVEECSSRLPIDIKERDKIKTEEIEPFVKELVTQTVRYVQPPLPPFIHSQTIREELTDVIVQFLPAKGLVYKGMPLDRDLTIMADATFIYRKFKGKEQVYLASIDYHFIPNRVQVGSYLSGHMKFLENKLDSGVRDKLAMHFGFIGDEPLNVLEALRQEVAKEKA